MAKKSSPKLNRPIVVSVMGHVDHGKTSLLDAIRGTRVQMGEAGGITQNTRTHQINYKDSIITFIDTPGHEAFSQMRSRGAKVTDIVMLVVAADDGVQPQTKESIKFANESKVPILVALNKTDLKGVKTEKIKNELAQFDVLIEEFGGDSMLVEVSAKTKKGIDDLLDAIVLQAEILELKKNKVVQGTAEAFVMESYLDKTKGPVTVILVKAGEINRGDYMIYPGKYKKVRSLMTEFDKEVDKVSEGDPVNLIGADEVLPTGELLLFESNQDKAEEIAKKYGQVEESAVEAEEVVEEALDDLGVLAQLLSAGKKDDETKTLNVILKTDVQGTLEAVSQKVRELAVEGVKVNILSAGTGSITEKDILTAKNSKGVVLGFQSEISAGNQILAKREKVLVRNYGIIYQLLEELGAVVNSMIEPEEEVVELAKLTVKKIFLLNNGKKVAGCRVTKGKVLKGYQCLVLRNEEEIGNGKITSLKQNKLEVKEVKKEQECGILIEPEIELEEGDEVVCYKITRG